MSLAILSSSSPRAFAHDDGASVAASERLRAANYPLSRWYLRPLAGLCARALRDTRVTPCHLTCCGFLLAALSAVLLIVWPHANWLAAAALLAYWFCDRMDGQLARLTAACTPFGAWFDANVDELADLGIHAALAYAATQAGSAWAWPCYLGFAVGKYLLMYGLFVESASPREFSAPSKSTSSNGNEPTTVAGAASRSLLRQIYHWPANADVRFHLLAVAMLTGQYVGELALVAAYYNLRWLLRYLLVARRLGAAT